MSLKNVLELRIAQGHVLDSEDQDQGAHYVLSDLGFTLSDKEICFKSLLFQVKIIIPPLRRRGDTPF